MGEVRNWNEIFVGKPE